LIQVLTLLLIGAVGGFSSGLLGVGGGVILIPLLIYVGDTSIIIAASVSMVVIIFASSSGVLAHYGRQNIHFPTGIWMGVASVSGALAGSLLSSIFPEAFFYHLYIGLVGAAIVILISRQREDGAVSGEYQLRRFGSVIVGLFQGFVAGVLGIGGGFMVVPLMIRFLQMPIHKAVGTSLLVMLFSAVTGFIGKLTIGHYDFHIILWVVVGTIPATQIGALAAQKSSPRLLRLFLLFLLIGILVWMIRSIVATIFP
jgi:hypothetical protein